MPELPEVETIARELAVELTGRTITGVDILWPRSIAGAVATFKRHLAGERIVAVGRRGKFILFRLASGAVFTIHLRMTGKLLFAVAPSEKKHRRLRFRFHGGTALHLVDSRKFARARLWPQARKGGDFPGGLGPEPLLSRTVYGVLEKLTSRRAIKTVLLDQRVLAGIGNIYADEALFRAGIRPDKAAARLNVAEKRRLSQAIPAVLNQAIANMGTSFSTFRNSRNQSGSHQFRLQVYGRDEEPCRRCRTPIRKTRLNGRGCHFCPECQR